MEINNYCQIRNLLSFDDKSSKFYFIQVLKRKKDQPLSLQYRCSDAEKIRTYWIDSLEYLEKKIPTIIEMCKHFNARAYIDLTPRTYEAVANEALLNLAIYLKEKNYKAIRKLLDTSAGKSFQKGEYNRWVVDIDKEFLDKTSDIVVDIEKCLPNNKNKVIATIPTVSGCHLITKPFDVATFHSKWPDITVQKNNPTLLYYYGID